MTPHRSSGARPLVIVLLAIPALLGLGVVKGCNMAEDAVSGVADEIQAPPAVRSPEPRGRSAPEPPRLYRIEKQQGWRV
jgi:hypothetical protein